MTSVSLFQFSLCFKSPRTPQKCGVFVCLYFWIFFSLGLVQLIGADSKANLSEIKLRPDSPSTISASDQIKNVFGKYSVESPLLQDWKDQDFEHIKIVKDNELESSFMFSLRRDIDGDRNKTWPKGKERQRNEIKGYQSSPEPMKAISSETHQIKWYLKIDKSFQINKQFCHFFQLKAVGTKNIDDPVLTLSGVTDRGKPQLQLQWWSLKDSGRIFLTDWESCKGKWLVCECISKYSQNGSIHFSVRSMDGEINQKKQLKKLETWRDGFSFVRPKWGIYRSLANEREKLNQEDRIWMTNFSIQKF